MARVCQRLIEAGKSTGSYFRNICDCLQLLQRIFLNEKDLSVVAEMFDGFPCGESYCVREGQKFELGGGRTEFFAFQKTANFLLLDFDP